MKHKKQICLVLLIMLLTINITSCGNGLMKRASLKTSALAFYNYDGEKIYRSYIFNSDTTQKILDELDSIKTSKAKEWSLDDITLPIYGLEIGSTDGTSILIAWSNNFWITQDGTAYIFKFDFKNLAENYAWEDENEFASFSVFPCARFLTEDENGWNSTLLTPAAELDAPDGVTMILNSRDDNTISVNIVNDSNMNWSYGEYYTLQVLLNEVWYEIPAVPGNWAFFAIGWDVEAGKVREKNYYLDMYGILPTGTYRLVNDGLSVEFTIS